MADTESRWTEIEHLPEWDEEFYHIYTAKKFGKWVMIKTLRPEYASDPRYQAMIEQEFDVRYSLAHPNIVMINDFEEIPGIGRCIVTDDVYGDSLRKLIDTGKVTPQVIEQLRHQLLNALEYIQSKHIVHPPLTPDNIIFTENIGNLKLIDVGYEQRPRLSHQSVADDIYNYGLVLTEALDAAKSTDPVLRRGARRCSDADPKRRFTNVQAVHLALENRRSSVPALIILIFLLLMVLLVVWLMSPYRPEPPEHTALHNVNTTIKCLYSFIL